MAAHPAAPTLTLIVDDVPTESVASIEAACAAQGVACAVLDVRDAPAVITPLPPGSALFRPATSFAAEQLEGQLFAPGVATFHRDDTHGPLRGCTLPTLTLERAGLPLPRGVWVHDPDRDRLRAQVAHVGGLPVVLKAGGGEGGVGVLRADSWAGLFGLVDYLHSQGTTPRLMAYVPDGVHWRLVVVGDAVVAAYPNPVAADDFRSQPSGDAADYTAAPDPEWAALAVEATQALGVAFGGVDLLVHPSGRAYLLECNFPCYYPQAQTVGGIDVAGPMVAWLAAKARRLRAG